MAMPSANDGSYCACEGVSQRTNAFVQLSRYSVVSLLALAADFGIYIALCALAVNAPVAGVTGYAIGMIAHYALSTAFVFDVAHAQKSAPRRLVEFAASGLLGLILTGFVIAILTDVFAASAIMAKAAAVGVSFLAVFLVRRQFVFAPASDKKISGRSFVYSKSGSGH
jgi:putative flippase GtrA